METLPTTQLVHLQHTLRENHSGMETLVNGLNEAISVHRCVRTIVVWKLVPAPNIPERQCPLRENHSGMETEKS